MNGLRKLRSRLARLLDPAVEDADQSLPPPVESAIRPVRYEETRPSKSLLETLLDHMKEYHGVRNLWWLVSMILTLVVVPTAVFVVSFLAIDERRHVDIPEVAQAAGHGILLAWNWLTLTKLGYVALTLVIIPAFYKLGLKRVLSQTKLMEAAKAFKDALK